MVKPTYEEDLLRSKTLHGSTWKEGIQRSSFISKLSKKNHHVHQAVFENYVDNWKEDHVDGSDNAKTKRLSAHTVIANSYYDIFTDFFEVSVLTAQHNRSLMQIGGIAPVVLIL